MAPPNYSVKWTAAMSHGNLTPTVAAATYLKRQAQMSGDKHPVMNDTKWTELRLGMYNLGSPSPKWRVKAMPSGYVSAWDGEWFHHFYAGGYSDIEWVEIETASPEQELAVTSLLQSIHVPGHKTEHGYKVYGYVSPGQRVDYVQA